MDSNQSHAARWLAADDGFFDNYGERINAGYKPLVQNMSPPQRPRCLSFHALVRCTSMPNNGHPPPRVVSQVLLCWLPLSLHIQKRAGPQENTPILSSSLQHGADDVQQGKHVAQDGMLTGGWAAAFTPIKARPATLPTWRRERRWSACAMCCGPTRCATRATLLAPRAAVASVLWPPPCAVRLHRRSVEAARLLDHVQVLQRTGRGAA